MQVEIFVLVKGSAVANEIPSVDVFSAEDEAKQAAGLPADAWSPWDGDHCHVMQKTSYVAGYVLFRKDILVES